MSERDECKYEGCRTLGCARERLQGFDPCSTMSEADKMVVIVIVIFVIGAIATLAGLN